jgi:hypothetical protein
VTRVLVVLGIVSVAVLVVLPGAALGQIGSIVAWGENDYGQLDVFPPNEGFTAVSGGGMHSLGLRSDGSITAWLRNVEDQCDVPAPNENFTAVAAGHIHSMGLKSDSTVVVWGDTADGKCNVPTPNAGFTAIAAGFGHCLGLKSDGSIVAWGWNQTNQCDVPAPNSSFVAVAAGQSHSLGLKSNGMIVGWGANSSGQCNVPAPNSDFVAVAAGGKHSLGLKSDGSVVAWGANNYFQCDVPAPNTDFAGISGGYWFSLGFKSDGTAVAWGDTIHGKCRIPSPNTDFVAIAGGDYHSLGIRGDDTPVESFFYATLVQDGSSVMLRWMLPGFPGGTKVSIYRALSDEGPYDCVEESVGDASLGNYVDATAWPGGTFWYELRAVLPSGDEVVASDVRPSVSVPGELRSGLRYIAPNPSRSYASIGYTLPEVWRAARLSVHDVAGRLVRRLDPAAGTRGYVSVEWDGRGDAGERAPSGVYFVRLDVDGVAAERKVVLLR